MVARPLESTSVPLRAEAAVVERLEVRTTMGPRRLPSVVAADVTELGDGGMLSRPRNPLELDERRDVDSRNALFSNISGRRA